MNVFNRSYVAKALLGTVCVLGASLPGLSIADESSPWSIKAYMFALDANENFGVDRNTGDRVEAGGDTTVGVGWAVEYRLNDLIGIEAAAAYAKTPDIDYESNGSSTEIGEGPAISPIQLAVNFHLLTTEKWDLYAGPRIAFVSFGDFDLNVDGQRINYNVDDEFGWGATVGASYQVGNGPISLIAELSYLDVEMNVTESGSATTETLDFNPTFGNFGVRVQF